MYFLKCVFIFCYFQLLEYSNGQPHRKFFRKDYTYLAVTESFYKIYTIQKSWEEAEKTCTMEGASLFYAEDKIEFEAVTKFWKETQPKLIYIFVGISDLVAKGIYETVDGVSVNDVYNNWEPSEPNDAGGIEDCVTMGKNGLMNDIDCARRFPFICKKPLSTLTWNVDCDTPYEDYVYDAELGKCYKFGSNPKNWTEAYTECSAEQSYLAVINNQAEADYLVNFTKNAKKNTKDINYLSGVVFLGFQKRYNGWRTIKGETLEKSGYARWGNGQPDGVERNVNEACGSMFYNGELNDIKCEHVCFYICEHDLPLLISTVERYGD